MMDNNRLRVVTVLLGMAALCSLAHPKASWGAYAGPMWYVNDESTVGDSFSTASGSDLNDGSRGAPFRTVGKAMSVVKSGETVLVDAGLYVEGVIINNDYVSIIGQDSVSAVIDPPADGSGWGYVPPDYPPDPNLPDTTGTKGKTGLLGKGEKTMAMAGAGVSKPNMGISASGRRGLLIHNLRITGFYYGVYFSDVDFSTISACDVSNNANRGLSIGNSSEYNLITGNIINSNSDGVVMTSSANRNIVTKNTVNSNLGIGFYVHASAENVFSGNIIRYNQQRGVTTTSSVSTNNVFRNNIMNNNAWAAVEYMSSGDNLVTQNDMANNGRGVWMTGSSGPAVIIKNNFTGNSGNNIDNASGQTLTLYRNWWGTPDRTQVMAKLSGVNAARVDRYRFSKIDTGVDADTLAPLPPSNIVAEKSPTQVRLKWSPPVLDEEAPSLSGTAGYKIYRSTSRDPANRHPAIGVVMSSSTTSFVDANPPVADTIYYWMTSYDTTPNGHENESWFSDTVVPTKAAPEIHLVGYDDYSSVIGKVTLAAVFDDTSIKTVEFLKQHLSLNGESGIIGIDTESPHSVMWDINREPPGIMLATIVGRDATGNAVALDTKLLITMPYVDSEFIVTYKTGVTTDEIDELNEQTGMAMISRYFSEIDSGYAYRLGIPYSETDVLHVVATYRGHEIVKYASANFIFAADAHPNDVYYPTQYAFQNMQAEGGWDIETGSSLVTIAVIDQGVEITHPDLAANIWVNSREVPNDGIDNDNNGYVDDVNGYDVANNDATVYNPGQSHGTNVAGIIAAATNNNSVGIAGTAWNCRIMPVKVALDGQAGLHLSDIKSGLNYAWINRANVINMSIALPLSYYCRTGKIMDTQEWIDVIDSISMRGCVIVASAGNSGMNLAFQPRYLDRFDSVVCVAALDRYDRKCGFSNYGNEVDVAAPGSEIKTTQQDHAYTIDSGTSFSAPYVAGLAALLFSHRQHPDEFGVADVIRFIKDSANDVKYANQWLQWAPGYLGKGRINMLEALRMIPPNVQITVDSRPSEMVPYGMHQIDLVLSEPHSPDVEPILDFVDATNSWHPIGKNGWTRIDSTHYRMLYEFNGGNTRPGPGHFEFTGEDMQRNKGHFIVSGRDLNVAPLNGVVYVSDTGNGSNPLSGIPSEAFRTIEEAVSRLEYENDAGADTIVIFSHTKGGRYVLPGVGNSAAIRMKRAMTFISMKSFNGKDTGPGGDTRPVIHGRIYGAQEGVIEGLSLEDDRYNPSEGVIHLDCKGMRLRDLIINAEADANISHLNGGWNNAGAGILFTDNIDPSNNIFDVATDIIVESCVIMNGSFGIHFDRYPKGFVGEMNIIRNNTLRNLYHGMFKGSWVPGSRMVAYCNRFEQNRFGICYEGWGNDDHIAMNDITNCYTGIEIAPLGDGFFNIVKNNIVGCTIPVEIWPPQIDNTCFDLNYNYWDTASFGGFRSRGMVVGFPNSAVTRIRFSSIDTASGMDTTAPAAPSRVDVRLISRNRRSVTWNPPVMDEESQQLHDIAGYRIYRGFSMDSPGLYPPIGTVAYPGRSFVDVGYLPPVPVYYWVTSYDTNEHGYENESWFSDTAEVPIQNKWFVNDSGRAGDSFTYASGDDTNGKGTPEAPYRTVRMALMMAAESDMIYVDAGMYDEAAAIETTSLALIGVGSGATVIDPPGESSVSGLVGITSVYNAGIIIEGMSVIGANVGIRFDHVGNSAVSGCSFAMNGSSGIYLTASSGNTFKRNMTERNASDGFVLANGSNNNRMLGNVSQSNGRFGFGLTSPSTALTGNVFTQNVAESNVSYAFHFDGAAQGNIIQKNNIAAAGGDSGFGVENLTGYVYDVSRNWWNTTDRAALRSKIAGGGSGNVLTAQYRFSFVDTLLGADTVAPAAPVGVTAERIDTIVRVSWTPVLADEEGGARKDMAGYRIYRALKRDPSGRHPSIASVSTSETCYIDTRPPLEQLRFYYWVTAYDTNPGGYENESWFSDTAILANMGTVTWISKSETISPGIRDGAYDQVTLYYWPSHIFPDLRMEVYDAIGRRVYARSVDTALGVHSIVWDGTVDPSKEEYSPGEGDTRGDGIAQTGLYTLTFAGDDIPPIVDTKLTIEVDNILPTVAFDTPSEGYKLTRSVVTIIGSATDRNVYDRGVGNPANMLNRNFEHWELWVDYLDDTEPSATRLAYVESPAITDTLCVFRPKQYPGFKSGYYEFILKGFDKVGNSAERVRRIRLNLYPDYAVQNPIRYEPDMVEPGDTVTFHIVVANVGADADTETFIELYDTLTLLHADTFAALAQGETIGFDIVRTFERCFHLMTARVNLPGPKFIEGYYGNNTVTMVLPVGHVAEPYLIRVAAGMTTKKIIPDSGVIDPRRLDPDIELTVDTPLTDTLLVVTTHGMATYLMITGSPPVAGGGVSVYLINRFGDTLHAFEYDSYGIEDERVWTNAGGDFKWAFAIPDTLAPDIYFLIVTISDGHFRGFAEMPLIIPGPGGPSGDMYPDLIIRRLRMFKDQ